MSDNTMPERLWAQYNRDDDTSVQYNAWSTRNEKFVETEYIRADVAQAQLDAANKRIAQLEAALRHIAACRCETYTAGDCTSHGEHYIDAIYTADGICDTCIANAALAGQLDKLPRMFPPLPLPPVTDVTP